MLRHVGIVLCLGKVASVNQNEVVVVASCVHGDAVQEPSQEDQYRYRHQLKRVWSSDHRNRHCHRHCRCQLVVALVLFCFVLFCFQLPQAWVTSDTSITRLLFSKPQNYTSTGTCSS